MVDLEMFLCAGILSLLCAGVGIQGLKKLKIEQRGFAAPIGAAIVFTVLEIVLLPCTVFSWSIRYASVMIALVGILAFGMTIRSYKEILQSLRTRELWGIAVAVALYFFAMSRDATLAGSSNLIDVMVANSTAQHVNLLTFRLQGYALFGSVFMRLFDPCCVQYMLGMLYHMILAMFCLNVLRGFHLKNQWFGFTLTLYALCYTGFNKWLISDAYACAGWRVLFLSMMLWIIYCWLRDKNEQEKYLLLFATGAGMFTTGGFALLSGEIFYCLSAYLFKNRRTRSFFDLTTFLAPYMFYNACRFGKQYPLLSIFVILLYAAFLRARYQKKLRRKLISIEDFLFDHGAKILWVYVPLCIAIVTVILSIVSPGAVVPYSFYSYFLSEDTTRSYLFMDEGILNKLVDVIRYAGIVIFLIKTQNDEERWMRGLLALTLLVFLNPLTMGVYARIAGIEVYAYSFDILFNPFCDILFFIYIYRMFEWQPFGQWILEIFLVAAVLVGNAASYRNLPYGLYTAEIFPAAVTEEINP